MTRPQGYAAALASLPGMGPATLVRLLSAYEPGEAWARVRAGRERRPPRVGRVATGPAHPVSPVGPTLPWDGAVAAAPPGGPRSGGPRSGGPRSGGPQGTVSGPDWPDLAARLDPDALGDDLRARAIQVTWWGSASFPVSLRRDPEPPGVLFWRGDLDQLERPCVAVVGTRRPTPDGRRTAFELGRDLAAAGVCVVSGLARGIDGSAHAGALAGKGAGTVGVAASGVDVPYPACHAELWEQVVAHGAVCGETPPGRPAQAWRFPVRNRVIAGLSRLVVVVESHATGGSLITAEAALARGIDVAAVPGPVRSPASAGTNQLLADGPGPVRHAGDVLDAIGLVSAWPPLSAGPQPAGPQPAGPQPAGPQPARRQPARPQPGRERPARPPIPSGAGRAGGADRRGVPEPGPAAPPPEVRSPWAAQACSPTARAVLGAVPWRLVSLNHIVESCALSLHLVSGALEELEAAGLVEPSGAFWQRVGPG